MKKLIAPALTLILALTLCACGNGSSASDNSSSAPQTEAVTQTATEEVTQTATETATKAGTEDSSYVGTWEMTDFESETEQPDGTLIEISMELNADNTFTVNQKMQVEAYIGEMEITGDYTINGSALTLNTKRYKATASGETTEGEHTREFKGTFGDDGKLTLQLEGAVLTMVKK